jgi:hypothetical protein
MRRQLRLQTRPRLKTRSRSYEIVPSSDVRGILNFTAANPAELRHRVAPEALLGHAHRAPDQAGAARNPAQTPAQPAQRTVSETEISILQPESVRRRVGGGHPRSQSRRLCRVSRPVELHHRPLAEPSMRLSPHSAPIRQTCRSYRSYRY